MFYSEKTVALSFQRWINIDGVKKSLDVRLLLVIMFFFISVSCQGQHYEAKHEWSQWLGYERLGIWHLDISKDTLVDSDLKKLWEVPVGTGYSGPTVSGGRVYLMDYTTDSLNRERVICLDADTGEFLWIHEYECSYSVGYPTGPKASARDRKMIGFRKTISKCLTLWTDTLLYRQTLNSLSRESGNIIFIKPAGKSLPDYIIQADLTSSSKRHKKHRKEVNMRTHTRVYGRGRFN